VAKDIDLIWYIGAFCVTVAVFFFAVAH